MLERSPRGRRRARASRSRTIAPEARALLEWMDDGHFMFLGYRYYGLERGRGRRAARGVRLRPRNPARSAQGTTVSCPSAAGVRRQAREKTLLGLTKANSRSTVHRPATSTTSASSVRRRGRGGRRAPVPRALHLSAYSASPWESRCCGARLEAVIEHSGSAAATTLRRWSTSSRPFRATSSSRSRQPSSRDARAS